MIKVQRDSVLSAYRTGTAAHAAQHIQRGKKEKMNNEKHNNDTLLYYSHSRRKGNSVNIGGVHCHNSYELIFFLDGQADYLIEDRKYNLKKYDLIITQPMNYHNIDILSANYYERINILIGYNPELIFLLNEISRANEVVNCAKNSYVCNNLIKLDYYEKKMPRNVFYTLLSNILIEICYCIIYDKNIQTIGYSPISTLIQDSLKYINDNLYTIKSISEISNYFFISKNYFFMLFKKEMHVSPKQYILTKRLLHSQILLSNGEKPSVIYEKCGFNNYVAFYKQYLKYFGYPPSAEPKKSK